MTVAYLIAAWFVGSLVMGPIVGLALRRVADLDTARGAPTSRADAETRRPVQ